MKRTLAIFVSLLLLASMLGATAVVTAPKPEKPPGGGDNVPPGTLFFKYNDGSDFSVWTMKADGSEKNKVTLTSCEVGQLSRNMHGGRYWYVGFCGIVGEIYPDGTPRHELFALRDDRAMAVQLTDDPSLQPTHWEETPDPPFWGPQDISVSWGALKWVCDPECVIDEDKAGYFDAAIVYDANGDIAGAGTPALVWWTGIHLNPHDYWVPNVGCCFDWSPDGTKIVRTIGTNVNVIDLVQGTETALAQGWYSQWSPDGSKIVFRDGQDRLRTIHPDGSNDEVIFTPRENSRGWYMVDDPRWSPDSSHVSFGLTFFDNHMWTFKHWIYRVDVNGDRSLSMTNNLPAGAVKVNVGWR